MDTRSQEQAAALTGVAVVACLVAGFFLGGIKEPGPGSSIQQITTFFQNHRSGTLLQGYLAGLAVVFIVWFSGILRTVLRRSEGEEGRLSAVAFAGGLLMAATMIGGVISRTLLAYDIEAMKDSQLVATLYGFGNLSFVIIWFPAIILLGPTALLTSRKQAFPAWHGWLSGILCAVFLIAGAAPLFNSGPFAPAGNFGIFSFTLTMLWLLITSLLVYQKATQASN